MIIHALYFTLALGSGLADCNLNGIDDALDISSGTSADCNSNGIPDECELGAGTSQVAGSVLVDSGASGVTSAVPLLGDRVGFAPLALPDLNGDGLSDLAIGAPQRDSSTAENVGAVILTGVGPTGASSWASVLDVSVGPLGALEVGDRFGAALASLGDIDSNGTLELAVGAPGDDAAGENEGAVWLLRISSGGTLASAGKIAEGSSGFTGALATGDSFGSAIAAIGDLNDDGTPDLAVGAPRHDEDGENTGAVWILFMEPAGTVLGSTRIDAASPALLGTLQVGDRFGSSVSLLGDLDLDGTTEIAVGAPRRDGGVDNGGAVFICSLDAAGQLVAVQEISGAVGGLSTLPEVGDRFGSSLACIGDHNIDGVPDLVVGRPGSDTGGENAGAVDLLLLNTDGTVAGQQLIAEGLGGFSEDLEVGADFGAGLASAGDLDGDGFLDLLVGAPRTDSTADNAGALWQLTFGSVDNDCDADGIPDECGFDCDGNGQPDACDIAADASLDCDGDGLLDSCEIAANASLDCDLDGILDGCEILLDQTLDWDGDGILDACAPPQPVYCVGNTNSTGQVGSIEFIGSPIVGANDFTIRTANLPTAAPAYYVFSFNTGFVNPFGGGDGVLCLGAPIRRFNPASGYSVLFSNAAGEVTFTPDLTAMPAIGSAVPGDLIHFQLWHREFDAFGNPTSNTSSGGSVMFR